MFEFKRRFMSAIEGVETLQIAKGCKTMFLSIILTARVVVWLGENEMKEAIQKRVNRMRIRTPQ